MQSFLASSNRRALASAFAGLALCGAPLSAQILTGFETSNGYTSGASVIGVNDTGIPGSAAWTAVAGFSATTPIASSAHPQSGAMAWRLERTVSTTGAVASRVDLSGAGVNFASTPITLSFGLSINNFSAGTVNQFQIYFGDADINPAGGRYWSTIIFTDGSFHLYKASVDGTQNVGVNLGAYTTYSPLGSYITFSVSFNPVTKTYTDLSLSGSVSSASFASTIAGERLPWRPNLAGEPGKFLTFVAGGNDIIQADIDNLSISTIPEPAQASLLVGGALAAFAALRRRRPTA